MNNENGGSGEIEGERKTEQAIEHMYTNSWAKKYVNGII